MAKTIVLVKRARDLMCRLESQNELRFRLEQISSPISCRMISMRTPPLLGFRPLEISSIPSSTAAAQTSCYLAIRQFRYVLTMSSASSHSCDLYLGRKGAFSQMLSSPSSVWKRAVWLERNKRMLDWRSARD